MKLATLKEFADTHFTPGSRPTMPRLRRMAESGDIPAKRIGARWFVDLEQMQQDHADGSDELLRAILSS